MAKKPVRIMDVHFNLLAEINLYTSLQITRKWHGVGDLVLHVNKNVAHVEQLQKGNILFPYDNLNKAYIIRHREISLDDRGIETWVIRALHLKSWLGQRITIPPHNKATDAIQSNAETVMRHLIANNAVSPADSKRAIPNLVLADNLNRGPEINWASRYKVLSEELEKISAESKLGWNVELDVKNKRYVVRILEGEDKTFGQRDRRAAIFSPEFRTLKSLNYLESDLEYKNHALVAGQGEGVDRRIYEMGDEKGIDRYELFVDARDIEEEVEQEEGDPLLRPVTEIENDLRNRGNQKLMEHEQEEYLDGEAFDLEKLKYEVDWDLGDFVTIQNKEWNVTTDLQITEVKEIYEGGTVKIEPLFGQDRPDLISKIKQELTGVESEVTK